MADLDVEKKENNDWWKWLLGLIALALIVWFIIESFDNDDDRIEDDDQIERVDTTANASINNKDGNIYIAKF